MDQSLRQSAAVVQALDETFGAGDGLDRRRAARVVHSAPLVVSPLIDEIAQEPLAVNLVDYSAVGLCIAHMAAMPVDSQFRMDLACPDGEPLAVICTVRRCEPAADGYRIGAEFTEIIGRALDAEPMAAARLDWLDNSAFPPRSLRPAA